MEDAHHTSPADVENRKVALHEAAHAVMFWNLGIGVRRVWIDRIRHCGNAQALRRGKGRHARISGAVACMAGLAVQSYTQEETRQDDIVRCYRDFRMALADFLPPGNLTDGEQLGAALELARRVAVLLQAPEIKRQIRALAPPLLKSGCLFQRQVNSILQSLTESNHARRLCREFVANLELARGEIVAGARNHAPDFRWAHQPQGAPENTAAP